MGRFLGALGGGIVLGTLVRYRVLPFFRDDTILAGKRLVPTEQWATFASKLSADGVEGSFFTAKRTLP
jgi:hypothetical protein